MSRDNTLVSAEWVEENLDNPQVVLVEVDEDTTSYDKGHIRGAIKLDWTTDLQDQVRRDIVDRDQFAALLSAKGVSNDDTVVLYGGNNRRNNRYISQPRQNLNTAFSSAATRANPVATAPTTGAPAR